MLHPVLVHGSAPLREIPVVESLVEEAPQCTVPSNARAAVQSHEGVRLDFLPCLQFLRLGSRGDCGGMRVSRPRFYIAEDLRCDELCSSPDELSEARLWLAGQLR